MSAARPYDEVLAPIWTYRRATTDVVEFGTVRGHDVALPAHFHDEDQFIFVRSGRRRFLFDSQIVTIEAGRCAFIRAGVVHRSLAEPSGVDCLNLYVPPGEYALAALASSVERLGREAAELKSAALAGIVQKYRLCSTDEKPSKTVCRATVAERASKAGLSREGFSRAFARERGMPPHAFELVTRLNHARRLLRHGMPPVDVAIDAGFADQSHLGRCFRRTFGVTPGQYRAG